MAVDPSTSRVTLSHKHARDLATAWRLLEAAPAAAARIGEKLLRKRPGAVEPTILLAAASRRAGDVKAARDMLAPCIAGQPALPVGWFEWGALLSEMDQGHAAIGAYVRAVRLAPGYAEAWRALGSELVLAGDGDGAWQAYAAAARAELCAHAALGGSAAALAELRTMAEAEALRLRLAAQVGDDAQRFRLLGELAMRFGDVPAAETLFCRALAVAGDLGAARHDLAMLHYGQRRFVEAASGIRAMLKVHPYQASLSLMLANCYAELGDLGSELPLYEEMLARFCERPRIWLNYGHVLKAFGREAQAAAAYRSCIALDPPDAATAHLSLADLKMAALTDQDVAPMRRRLTVPGISDHDRAQLHYALARAAEQRGEYEEAFAHLASGAGLRRRAISYDPASVTAHVAAVSASFTSPLFAERAEQGCRSDAPIFVVGLPRSGTTLVEQILASHPDVEATAELSGVGTIAAALLGPRASAAWPDIVRTLDPDAPLRLGEHYLATAASFRRLGRRRFTDKMPGNILHAGLIQLMLPNARIIDVRRDAMPAGFAAFRQFFQPWQVGMDFTYDLAEIGLWYRDYVALTSSLDAARPGHIHRLRYEDLVQDTEGEIRRLLDHCGLSFEPGCLRFWETARAVQTPSALQVRRPISRRGLDEWRRYAAWLGPLRDALGPLARD